MPIYKKPQLYRHRVLRSWMLAVLLCLIVGGCQLPLAHYFQNEVFPQDTTTKIVLSPLLFPAYAVCSVMDIAIINPARGCSNVPEVTSDIFAWPQNASGVTHALLMPLKIIAVPPAAIGTALFSEQFLYEQKRTHSFP